MDVQGLKADAKANTEFAKQKCREAKLTTLEDIWKNKNLLRPGEWKRPFTQERFNDFIVMVSEVFAEETSGTAHLLISDSIEPRINSIFFANEFPAMKASGKVEQVKRMNFDNNKVEKPEDVTTLWWKKGDADPKTRP